MSRAAAKSTRKKTPTGTSLVKRYSTSGHFIDEDHIVLERGGKAVGVVISMDELRYFQALEDRLDIREIEKALADPKRIPYEEVRRRRLGL